MHFPTPEPNDRVRLTHIQFSGLGGHLREFAAFTHLNSAIKQSAIFLGNIPVTEELQVLATAAAIPYCYVSKPPGANFKPAWSILKKLWLLRPTAILIRSIEATPIAWIYRIFSPRTRIIVVETQASRLKSPKQRLLSKFAMKTANAVVVLSQAHKEELRQEHAASRLPSKVQVIPNGIDTELFRPGPSAKEHEFRVGMQSRFVIDKDHPTLLRAFQRLPEKLSDGRVTRLVLAGSGEEENRLRQLCQDYGIQARVDFLGELSTHSLIEAMQGLDLYVHATHGESFCFSVMEALSIGLPVITSDVPVLNQTLANLPFVRFYPPGCEDRLATQILDIAKDPTLYDQSRQARKFACENLDHKLTLEQYVKLITNDYPGRSPEKD